MFEKPRSLFYQTLFTWYFQNPQVCWHAAIFVLIETQMRNLGNKLKIFFVIQWMEYFSIQMLE